AKDDWIVIAIGNDTLWQTFCKAVQRNDLASDGRFAGNRERTAHLTELNAILEPLFGRRTVAEWSSLFSEVGIPHSRINNIEQMMQSRQVHARNMIATVQDSLAGAVSVAGNPIKMTNLEDSTERPAIPELGEHTAAVLEALGYDDDQIAAMHDQGVI
ncbi:MAG TPA: CoA transferase, partial [Alkalispirochaeta sp.]|nr:CoA transferase [Alkalispirochaeta sp.]